MSKQSVRKSGKVVPFPGTQPLVYRGREVHLCIGIWPGAKGRKDVQYDEKDDNYIMFVSAKNLEQGCNRIREYADELGVCLEGG